MAEPFSHIESGKIDDSTKLDKGKNVKVFSGSSTKGVRQIKDPKQELKTHYSARKEFLHRDNLPHVGASGKSALIISERFDKKLDLSGQGLTELPKPNVLKPFFGVEELNLSNNPLSPDISFFKHARFYGLKKLDLSGCGLTELPEDLDFFNELEELNLSNNPLNHSISFLKCVNFSELKKLDLSGCGLTELAMEFVGLLYRLEELNLSNNPLSHDTSLFQYFFLPELKKLHLSGCGFIALPKIIYYYPELEELNLSNNPLSNVDMSLINKSGAWNLKKLDLSSCGLTTLPKDLGKCSNLQELNFSNNSFDHQDLLEKLNSGKMFSYSECQQSGEKVLKPTTGGLQLFKPTCRIIFKDAVYIRSSGVWTVEHGDVASTRYVSSTKESDQGQIQNKEIWLREFCHIRKSKKLTIETYFAMLQSLNIVCDLFNIIVLEIYRYPERKSTLSFNRSCSQILHLFSRRISSTRLRGSYIDKCVSNFKRVVHWLRIWFSRADDSTGKLKHHSVAESESALKEASEAFSKKSDTYDKMYAATLMIISVILSNLTQPEAAVLRCLQTLQELHDLKAIRVMFSVLDRQEKSHRHYRKSVDIAESVLRINKILFEFVGLFLKPPPTLKEWPATIQLDERSFNPLIDKRLLEYVGYRAWDDDKLEDLITDALQYSVPGIEEIVGNRITVDQAGGCFSLPEVSAFLLFPPNAVEHEITLQCSRVKFKECVKPRDGEAFVSRILKVEPAGVIFNKPVTVLLSHSLDEDDAFLYYYELIVENFSPSGWQELKTERIRFFEDIPKEITKKEILKDNLPFAKATIQETCTLVAATRATLNQILIPTNKPFTFSKQYGDSAELKITFPAGVTEKIRNLNVQIIGFPTSGYNARTYEFMPCEIRVAYLVSY